MVAKVHSKSASAKKRTARVRRAAKTRAHIKSMQVKDPSLVRLCITRSSMHIGVQLIQYNALEGKSVVVASATTKEKLIKEKAGYTGNVNAAKIVGQVIAERALAANLKSASFDRSGHRYHGRVKALADAAREAGLQI
jgi:large subunit ribosomal protein L18